MQPAAVLAEMARTGARFAVLPGWRQVTGTRRECATLMYCQTADEAARAVNADYRALLAGSGELGTVWMRGRDGTLTWDVDLADAGPALRAAIWRVC